MDRPSRDRAAALIRRFNAGQITNDEYEDAYPRESADLGVQRIYEQVWFAYDDLCTHRLEGPWALPPDWQALLDRCALFLESDREYEWPPDHLWGCLGLLRWLPPVWFWLKHRERQYEAAGQIGVWPFLRQRDYAEELCRRRV